MPTIIIDGESYEVDGNKNLLETCLQLGQELPYFCWHPAMGSVGSCRQCAVKQYQDADDTRGRIIMSCMTPVIDGMIISLMDEATQKFRDGCIEAVMANHPHDCPVCEEGGECHLQDMTNLSNHTTREYSGLKRTHINQNLGPFINHEMNRCIACYRCVRFYQDYAGGHDLQALGSGHEVYFGRFEDGSLENEFSGNLTEVCPTGVFTDRTFSKHYARKWDLQSAPSICSHCSVGCNISPGERYGTLRRIVNRYHGEINGYFLCDRGRFGYDFVNDDKRLKNPLIKHTISKTLLTSDRTNALTAFAGWVENDATTLVGIGSPRASLEANFALQQLVGSDNFYSGISTKEQQLHQQLIKILQETPATIASIKHIEKADAVLVLGEDVLNTAPRIALALQQASKNIGLSLAAQARIPEWQAAAVKNIRQNQRSPVFLLTPAASRIDEIASANYHGTAAAIAKLGFAIANAIDSNAPSTSEELSEQELDLVSQIAGCLANAKNPLIVSGTSCFDGSVLEAASNIATALAGRNSGTNSSEKNNPETNSTKTQSTSLCLVAPEVNSIGTALLGISSANHNLEAAYKRAGQADDITVLILENDLYRRADKDSIDKLLQSAKHIIAIDTLENDTTARADLVLPASSFAESEGTYVNNEGRAQRYFAVFPPAHCIDSSWRWLLALNRSVGKPNKVMLDWQHLDELTGACEQHNIKLMGIVAAAPDAEFRIAGCKVARQPHRYSGRGTNTANISVNEIRVAQDEESALAFSMEGLQNNLPPALTPGVWEPGWNSNEAVNQRQASIGGELKGGDPGALLFQKTVTNNIDWFSPTIVDTSSSPQLEFELERQLKPVPLYHIFGSEEHSANAWSISEKSPQAYAALNHDDAEHHSLTEGDIVLVQLGATELIVVVAIDVSLAAGTIGLPCGLAATKALNAGSFEQLATLKKLDSNNIHINTNINNQASGV